MYRTPAIITRSWFETALDYKPRFLGPKIEEFPILVHKLSVILTDLQYTYYIYTEVYAAERFVLQETFLSLKIRDL